jgi:tetratricopeptide (TPR) repeat protein
MRVSAHVLAGIGGPPDAGNRKTFIAVAMGSRKCGHGSRFGMPENQPMTLVSPALPLSAEEEEQLRQTIEMFEVITQANPHDTQSMEILKEAYSKIGRQDDATGVQRRLAAAFMELGQYSSAMLEYENILQKDPDNAEIIAALGEVEERLRESQKAPQRPQDGAEAISLDFGKIVDGGQIMATKQTQSERPGTPGPKLKSGGVRVELGANDGNDALVKFLLQHKLAPEDVVTQAVTIARRKNKDRAENQLACSVLDEIIARGSGDSEQLICGILDRSKFAYIPLDNYDVDRQIVRMLPENLTLGRLIVPFDILSRTMMVAVANPFDAPGKEAVQQLVDYNVQWHFAEPAAVLKILNDVYQLQARK